MVDVSSAPDDTVIGDRSFSADPAVVTAYAGAYARGLRDAGLLPVLKHFPGHGHGSGDSHTGEVTTPPLADLLSNDLVPYRTLITASPVAVMVGHLQVPGLTGDDPASLSRPALQLLREGAGYGAPPFNGPVISDDVSSMAAISDRYGVAEAVLRTLRPVVDVALWVTTDEVSAVLDRLQKAVAAGELSTQAVDASLSRIVAAKGTQRVLRALAGFCDVCGQAPVLTLDRREASSRGAESQKDEAWQVEASACRGLFASSRCWTPPSRCSLSTATTRRRWMRSRPRRRSPNRCSTCITARKKICSVLAWTVS